MLIEALPPQVIAGTATTPPLPGDAATPVRLVAPQSESLDELLREMRMIRLGIELLLSEYRTPVNLEELL